MNVTQNQENYLEVILNVLKNTVKENNIPQEYFEEHFTEFFAAAHNAHQKFLKGLLNNKELKEQILEEIWNELQVVA